MDFYPTIMMTIRILSIFEILMLWMHSVFPEQDISA